MFIVHGLTRSYFTRKVTGYLDFTDRPYRLEPCPPNLHPEAEAAGWTGGIPVVTDPTGEFMWDSTTIIEHLDIRTDPARHVLPDDPTLRFLVYLLDDFSDEWFYRPAVGSRWNDAANTEAAGWQITEELSTIIGLPGGLMRPNIVATMKGNCPKLGVVDGSIDAWMDEVVRPWFDALEGHLGSGYLFGDRPSLADFAVYGANVAHFVGDPVCRDLVDEHSPAAVEHTHRLTMPQRQVFGDWTESTPDSLIPVLAEMGRHYLPWVTTATIDGAAPVTIGSHDIEIRSSAFLDSARAVMLARYLDARSPELDAVLDAAGILGFFAGHVDQAGVVPDPTQPARPADNRPYRIED
ncbi:MAG: glutathione S-transferase N-terminal domain-containing protein [Actinomycetota bacterium]